MTTPDFYRDEYLQLALLMEDTEENVRPAPMRVSMQQEGQQQQQQTRIKPKDQG